MWYRHFPFVYEKITNHNFDYTRFYYDFFFPTTKLSDTDLKRIKKEMDKIIKADYPIRREEVTRAEARFS